MHRIHIVGLNPRTGTTLLAECMRLCFEIERAEEHEASISKLRFCTGVYLTKKPRDTEHVALRLKLDPRFNVICMARDPRDVVVSKHGAKPDTYYDKTSFYRFRERWASMKPLLDHPRFMLVRYEDLIARPDEVQRQIAEKFPFLVQNAAFSSFHEHGSVSDGASLAMNGLRPIDSANHSKWPMHLDRLADQLDRSGSISSELIDLGYEKDENWMAAYGLPVTNLRPIGPPERQRLRGLTITGTSIVAGAMAKLGIPIG